MSVIGHLSCDGHQQIYKCVKAADRTTYSQDSCLKGAKATTMEAPAIALPAVANAGDAHRIPGRSPIGKSH